MKTNADVIEMLASTQCKIVSLETDATYYGRTDPRRVKIESDILKLKGAVLAFTWMLASPDIDQQISGLKAGKVIEFNL